ncbi:MAG: DUF2252 domain-containing protein, partial [Actinobacteria bacterium]|nr:DUF2252 domain-containing protein [Actinomycetota bacterium]
DRAGPVELLASQETARVPALLPLRHSRMAVSPFTFYRGAAAVMATDLASMPNSGLVTQLCGDAHLSNFGMFAAPDRNVVFDINDFDETNPGPFEWDVMRLSASFVLAGRDVKLSSPAIAIAAAAVGSAYRTQMTKYTEMADIDIWYDRVSVEVLQQWMSQEGNTNAGKRIVKATAKAKSRDMWSAISKMTELVDGQRRFISTPPLLMRVPLEGEVHAILTGLVDQYQATVPPDRAQLLRRYHLIDFAHKVVGVGSVGLLAFVLLLEGRDPDDLLVLQVKQAVPSVLEPFTEPSVYEQSGERVVVGQQIMQAASDVFLGWVRGPRGKDYYLRQLRDMKYSMDPSTFTESSLLAYATACGRALARAHARAGDSVAIAAYLGVSTKFDNAIRDFSLAYADQVTVDYAKYKAAVADGRVVLAAPGEGENYTIVASPTEGVSVKVASPEPPPASS